LHLQAKIDKWEAMQAQNEELQHERDEEFKKRIEAENKLLEEKQAKMEKQLEVDKLKMAEEQRRLEEEKLALAKESLRVYNSSSSSRADSGLPADPTPEPTPPPRRRRRRKQESDERARLRKEMGVGLQSHAAGPDFDKVKSKVGSHRSESRSYKPKSTSRVQIFDDKEYMRKVKRMHGGGEKRRRNKSRSRDSERPSSLQLQRVEDDMRGYESEPNHHRYR